MAISSTISINTIPHYEDDPAHIRPTRAPRMAYDQALSPGEDGQQVPSTLATRYGGAGQFGATR
jgi:hypothetical protein